MFLNKSIEKILTSDQKNSVLAAVKTYQSTVATSPNIKTVNGFVGRPPKVSDSSLQQLAFTLNNNPSNAKLGNSVHSFFVQLPGGNLTMKTKEIGSLVVYRDNSVSQSQADSVIRELQKNTLSNSHIKNLINDDEATYLVLTNLKPNDPALYDNELQGSRHNSYLPGNDGEVNNIIASPGYAIQFLRGKRTITMRPDIIIGHEVDHAQQKAKNYFLFESDRKTIVLSQHGWQYNYNNEEKRAWSNEVKISKAKGLSFRNSYEEPSTSSAQGKYIPSSFFK